MKKDNKQNGYIGIDKPKLTIVHLNTESVDVPIESGNDKISWIVLTTKEGKKQKFFPERQKEKV